MPKVSRAGRSGGGRGFFPRHPGWAMLDLYRRSHGLWLAPRRSLTSHCTRHTSAIAACVVKRGRCGDVVLAWFRPSSQPRCFLLPTAHCQHSPSVIQCPDTYGESPRSRSGHRRIRYTAYIITCVVKRGRCGGGVLAWFRPFSQSRCFLLPTVRCPHTPSVIQCPDDNGESPRYALATDTPIDHRQHNAWCQGGLEKQPLASAGFHPSSCTAVPPAALPTAHCPAHCPLPIAHIPRPLLNSRR